MEIFFFWEALDVAYSDLGEFCFGAKFDWLETDYAYAFNTL